MPPSIASEGRLQASPPTRINDTLELYGEIRSGFETEISQDRETPVTALRSGSLHCLSQTG